MDSEQRKTEEKNNNNNNPMRCTLEEIESLYMYNVSTAYLHLQRLLLWVPYHL